MGDSTREERLYGEASAADPTLSAPWFNLALLYKKQQRLEEARHAVEMAVGLEERSAPYYVLQAQIARAFGNEVVMKEILERAMGHFTTLVEQDEWELGWFITAVEMRGDRNAATLAREERSRRKVKSGAVRFEVHGVLPAMAV
jgi:tetratricopeptide (TPR) repeat protein